MVMRFLGLALACLIAAPAVAQDRFITVASTTSTESSGLFTHLLPQFTKATGITVRVVAVGTGQALRLGENGDADVVFVHDTASEQRFVEAGFGVDRRDVMYNDYVLVGPAPIGEGLDETLKTIAATQAPFASRGDDSGTHKAELRLWKDAGILPAAPWYRETGSGMGATLNTAAAMDAYALTDRGTWLNFGNRQALRIVVEGDARLANPYGIMLVNPARHPHVKEADARAFIDWLIGPQGQATIASYTINGQPLFFPNAAAH